MITNANGHDIDVTGVARVLLYETAPGSYQLSIVDQQVTPLYNLDRVPVSYTHLTLPTILRV